MAIAEENLSKNFHFYLNQNKINNARTNCLGNTQINKARKINRHTRHEILKWKTSSM